MVSDCRDSFDSACCWDFLPCDVSEIAEKFLWKSSSSFSLSQFSAAFCFCSGLYGLSFAASAIRAAEVFRAIRITQTALLRRIQISLIRTTTPVRCTREAHYLIIKALK